jgi:delta-aminolevulinic acid dehydratase/porphobilinogen synthase
VRLDVAEGADAVMVKPAGSYLDVLAAVRAAVDVPVAAYQVSGEMAMVEAAAQRGWIDRDRAILETLPSSVGRGPTWCSPTGRTTPAPARCRDPWTAEPGGSGRMAQ